MILPEFPYDQQNFFLTLDYFHPEHLIRFSPILEYSGLGATLGEEE